MVERNVHTVVGIVGVFYACLLVDYASAVKKVDLVIIADRSNEVGESDSCGSIAGSGNR